MKKKMGLAILLGDAGLAASIRAARRQPRNQTIRHEVSQRRCGPCKNPLRGVTAICGNSADVDLLRYGHA
jgi:hypothetical protein